ncbi:MAG: hypothetical protein ACKN9D_01365, partial [Actinomycetales bacterium]
QGAWGFLALALPEIVHRPLGLVSRPSSSSTAVGAHHRHDAEQRAIVEQAFTF